MEEKVNKGGRPRNFKTPEDLLSAWESYKKARKKEAVNWPKVQYVGRDGQRVEDYPPMPLTMEGFSVFCYKNGLGTIKQYFVNLNEEYCEYLTICSYIKEEIRENQITGGMLGVFNPSITQRLNNLKETSDVDLTSKGEAIQSIAQAVTIEIVKPRNENED